MKKNRLVVLALSILVSALLLTGCERGESRVFRAACNQPDGYPTVVGLLAFADYVYRETNGGIRIEVHNNASLGQSAETLQLTRMGKIEFNRLSVTLLASINPYIGAFGMPGIYRDREHMFRVLDGDIGDEALMMLERQGVIGLSWMDAGSRNFYNSQREVRVPADLAGMRIRVQEIPIMMGLVRQLGAIPVPMAMGEVYAGLRDNIIQGAENNWPSFTSWSHHEVARYFTVNGHVAAPEMILINAQLWNSLSVEEQSIIRSGAQYGARVQRQAWIEYDRQAEARARAGGVVVSVLTPEEQQLWSDTIAPMYASFPQFIGTINRIRAVP